MDHAAPAKTGITFITLLSALMAFTSLSTDIYLPALPAMSLSLHGNAELTVTGFLVGFAIAQLVWGPVSDRIGRRLPLFIGMLLFAIGSAGCARATQMPEIVFWRVFQAVGACTGPMLARAMIRDLFSRTRAAQMLSTLMIIMAIAPVAGPLLGGQIIRVAAWPMIFWFLTVVGLVMLVALRWLPETLPAERRLQKTPGGVLAHYASLLKNRRFMRFTLSVTFYYVAAYAFIVGSPAVYIRGFGIVPQHYGWLFAVNILGLIAISSLNMRLVQHFALESLLRVAAAIASLAVLLMCLLLTILPDSLLSLVICIMVFFAMNGVISACATAAALDAVPDGAGSASALIGSLQYGSGIVSSLLLAASHDDSPWTMVTIMTLFTLLSGLMVAVPRRQRRPAERG